MDIRLKSQEYFRHGEWGNEREELFKNVSADAIRPSDKWTSYIDINEDKEIMVMLPMSHLTRMFNDTSKTEILIEGTRKERDITTYIAHHVTPRL